MSRLPFPRLFPVLVLAAAALAGCAQPAVPTESAQVTTDNFSKAKAAGIRPVAVGEFRSVKDSKPAEARHLKDTLSTELSGAGLLDPASGAVVEGELVSAELGSTSGTVAARFIVTTGGRVVYDKELRSSSTWRADANVPREQGLVYSKLVGQLFTDPMFRNAVPR
jgi:hypothetical protein